jgi:hypothetical protein
VSEDQEIVVEPMECTFGGHRYVLTPMADGEYDWKVYYTQTYIFVGRAASAAHAACEAVDRIDSMNRRYR